MKAVCAFAVLLAVFGCASRPSGTGVLALSAVTALPPHLNMSCKLFDRSGTLLRKMPGVFCIYEADGSTLVAHTNGITKYNSTFKPVWFQNAKYLHHQFKKSEVSGNFLFMDSILTIKNKKTYRSDLLRIIDSQGNDVKKIRFNDILLKMAMQNHTVLPPARAQWLDAVLKNGNANFENSHVNSFYEYYENAGGTKTVAGYVINCFFQKKAVLIDKDFSRVVDVIDFGDRAVHDVQMAGDGNLIFYQNFAGAAPQPLNSSLVRFNLRTRAFTELYPSAYSSRACGSVQELGSGRYLLAHSNCLEEEAGVKQGAVEFVDVHLSQTAGLKFPVEQKINTAELVDATAYLQKNQGQ